MLGEIFLKFACYVYGTHTWQCTLILPIKYVELSRHHQKSMITVFGAWISIKVASSPAFSFHKFACLPSVILWQEWGFWNCEIALCWYVNNHFSLKFPFKNVTFFCLWLSVWFMFCSYTRSLWRKLPLSGLITRVQFRFVFFSRQNCLRFNHTYPQ